MAEVFVEKAHELARAIAVAEGYFIAHSLPERCNNPGDLELGDQGRGVDAGKTIFSTAPDGWAALYHECYLMLTGQSHVYKPSMTFEQVAQLYTGGDNPTGWAINVARELGMAMYDTLQEFLEK